MTPEEAAAVDFDPFDVTKVWPRGMLPQITRIVVEFPMHDLGKLVLNKNPHHYHRDVEQAAFSPGSMVPGI
jgi:catalase